MSTLNILEYGFGVTHPILEPDEVDYDWIAGALEDDIIYLEASPCKKYLLLTEQCDGYHVRHLTKKQAQTWVAGLSTFVETLVD